MISASFYSAGADVLRWLYINLWTGIKTVMYSGILMGMNAGCQGA